MFNNLNGEILHVERSENASPKDTFKYGYGLFETMLVINGSIRLYNYHSERLFNGIQLMLLQPGEHFTPHYLEQQIQQTVRANMLDELCRVRVQLFISDEDLTTPNNMKAGFLIECFPLTETDITFNDRGLDIDIVYKDVCKVVDQFSNLKSAMSVTYGIATGYAQKKNKDDALIYNDSGNIIESSIANVFWVKDGAIFTPPLSEGCVAGVMRRYIMEQTGAINEMPLTLNTLQQADEVFLTNAIKRIKWVRSFAESTYGCTLTRKLYHNLFNESVH